MGEQELDIALVERVQQGDKRAFDLLVRKYQHKIIGVISRYISDWSECQDVAQEAFIRAYRAIASFRGDSQFYTWMYKIAINTAKNYLVSQGRRPPTDDIAIDDAVQLDGGARLKDRATPEHELLRQEIEQTVFATVEQLPEDLKTAITLREVDGLSYEEIAETMNCPIGTVRSRIFRARDAIDQKLRPLLAGSGIRRMNEKNTNDQTTTDQTGADLINEQVSALMDGELPRDQLHLLMRRFETDAQLPQRWSRYQLMRGVIRHQVGAPLRVDFAHVVMQRLTTEAVPAVRRGGRVLRWVSGGAIAATVAVVALVMTRPGLQGTTPSALVATTAMPPTAIQDTRTVTPVSVPTMLNFDYAQPASFEKAPYGISGYELPRRRYEPVETGNGGIPYVLLTAPMLPPRALEHNPAQAPQQ